jgi:Fe-S-cluster containining protein
VRKPKPPKRPDGRSARLDALYAQLPAVDCVGLCWDSCGPIDMSAAERARIAAAGVHIPRGSFYGDGPGLCPALTMFKRCGVYEIRPLVCRIWGLTRRMPCTYGCKPERYLTEPEAYELFAQAFEISGQSREAADAHLAATPEHQARMRKIRDALDVQTQLVVRAVKRGSGGADDRA